jgi:hypothetical protein
MEQHYYSSNNYSRCLRRDETRLEVAVAVCRLAMKYYDKLKEVDDDGQSNREETMTRINFIITDKIAPWRISERYNKIESNINYPKKIYQN